MVFKASMVEISGIEPLSCAALTPPNAGGVFKKDKRSAVRVGESKRIKKQPPFGDCFALVEISGIEPLSCAALTPPNAGGVFKKDKRSAVRASVTGLKKTATFR